MFGRASDEQLVVRALDGSERAWNSLIKRYDKRLYNYALRMTGSKDDALDILQDVLMSVYRNLAGYRGDGVFAAWLFRIAAYRCTDYLRRRGRTPDMTNDYDTIDESNIDLEQIETNTELKRVMQVLSLEQRIVIELKFFQSFTFDEIAMQLGISPNTAKSRVYAALKKLKPEVDPNMNMREHA